MSRSSNKHSHNLSNGLTSEPMVVDTTTSTSDVDRSSAKRSIAKSHNSGRFQIGGGYKIILAPHDARKFIENVKNLQNTAGQKQSIDISNAVDYKNAAKHIESALMILSNDISPEKKKLETLKQELENLATINKFYVFDHPIICKVVIGTTEVNGELIAMDDGVVAVAKTEQGNFMVTLESQLEIEKHQYGGDKKGDKKISSNKSAKSTEKSIFTPSARVDSTGSEQSINSSLQIGSGDKSSRSSNSKLTSSNKLSSVKTSAKTPSDSNILSSSKSASSQRSSKIESPPTESVSSSAESSNTSTSPYLATSEYELPSKSEIEKMSKMNREKDNKNTKNKKSIEVSKKSEQNVSDSEMMDSEKESSYDKMFSALEKSLSNDQSNNTSSSSSPKSSESNVRSSSTKSSNGSEVESSNRSEYINKSGMNGGSRETTNKGTKKPSSSGLKFMKAGKSDNVGIMESTKGYYSESTSIEEGLCE